MPTRRNPDGIRGWLVALRREVGLEQRALDTHHTRRYASGAATGAPRVELGGVTLGALNHEEEANG